MADTPWRECETTVERGLQLRWRDYPGDPARTAVICLPGLTRNCRDFEQLAPHLVKFLGRRVIAPDLRGRGRSDADPDWRNYRLDVYVRDLLAVLDAASIERAVIVGTSLGGLVGMFLAVESPQRVAGLVLNDIGPELEPAGMLRIASGVGTARAASSWAEAAADARAANEMALPDLSDGDWIRFAKRVYRDDGAGRIVRDMDPAIGRAMREPSASLPDFWAAFAALATVPMLCLRGELSDLLSAETVQRMQAAHPGMQTCTIPRRGHAPTLDEPASCAALDAFIRPL